MDGLHVSPLSKKDTKKGLLGFYPEYLISYGWRRERRGFLIGVGMYIRISTSVSRCLLF